MKGFAKEFKLISSFVTNFRRRYAPHLRGAVKEISWDILTHFIEKGYFDKYDPNKIKNYENFILVGVRNFLIDKERYYKRRLNYLFSELSTGDKEFNPDIYFKDDFKYNYEMVISDIMDILIRDRNLDKFLLKNNNLKGIFKSEWIHPKDVIYMVMVGYSVLEISKETGVSYSKLKKSLDEAVTSLKRNKEHLQLI